MSAILLTISFAAMLVGCMCLAISQSNHVYRIAQIRDQKQAMGRLRVAGFILLLAAFGGCVARDGVSFSALLWPLLFAVSAVMVAMAIAFAPQIIRPTVIAMYRWADDDRT